ncbi:putative O-glycosylation ligase, exosortase A system-associated [Spartinivicinus poritis]|uniref:O-glycosylation ligase, exosortase A system-associated n=1 Tax=Spartinivicinus poritis TaxID=2994640 RepID=A0ABT5UE32_9GAMM|nr:putative O-glycosylation ligase, exosortase A system-associated [Spartinivicinus sp. A2-2]MDE1464615.1 putative O-glycosylation ligase, exosortase A system-associated [Spartinivicinus sp. A2-2]
MRDLLVSAIIFAAIPYILMNPHVGIYFSAWIGYMNPHRLGWGFAYNFPFAFVVAIVTILAFLFSKENKKLPLTSVTVVLILFIFWMGVSTALSIYPDLAWKSYTDVLKIQFLICLSMILIQSKKRIQTLVWIIAFSIGFFGIKGGLFSILSGMQYRVWGPPGSVITGNNELGIALLMVIPLFVYLFSTSSNKWVKQLLLGSILLCIVSVISTFSRGAFLASLCMFAFLWTKSKYKLPIAMAGLLGLFVLVPLVPDHWVERMGSIPFVGQYITQSEETTEIDESGKGRLSAWTMAYNIAKARVTGGGFNCWTPENFLLYSDPTRVFDAHSIYFEVLGEQGFPGLFLFLLLYLLAWRTGSWIIRHTNDQTNMLWANQLAKMIQVSFVAYATGGAFLGLGYFDLPYHLVCLLVVTQLWVKKELAKPVEVNQASIAKFSTEPPISTQKWPWEK